MKQGKMVNKTLVLVDYIFPCFIYNELANCIKVVIVINFPYRQANIHDIRNQFYTM